MHKTTFRCLKSIRTFEWMMIPFRLKNAGASNQRGMNTIFNNMIGNNIEVYIDDVLVKSKRKEDHIEHLRKSLEQLQTH